MNRILITPEDVEKAARKDGVLRPPGPYCLLPSAEDRMLKLGVRLEDPLRPSGRGVIAVASDHGGFDLKEAIREHLDSLGYRVLDYGTRSKESVDYPDFAHRAALAVSEGRAERAIVIDGAGIGSSIAANKVPGIRAAKCDSNFDVVNARAHNDSNVLSLGARLEKASVLSMVRTWLETAFEGGRHARRVDKIVELEKRYFK